MKQVTESFNRVYETLFRTDGANLDYQDITRELTTLANAVHCLDNDDWLYLGESTEICLPDLIIGAYWHFTEWHGGQWSDGYAALSALGQVFQPGMTSIESERAGGSSAVEAYDALEVMAA